MRCAVAVLACLSSCIALSKSAVAFVGSPFCSKPICGEAFRKSCGFSTARELIRTAVGSAEEGAAAAAAASALPSSRLAATKAPMVSDVALGLQAKLRRLCADKSEPDRETRIEELAEELSVLNPTKNPALSPLLKGRWRVLYSTVPGPSSGRLGPFVGNVFQDIRPDEGRIVNILELGPSWALRGALEADVEVLDGDNWAIIFDRVYNTFAGVQVQEKKFDREANERRIWNMTYLDEGFRVLYGRMEGMSEEEGFIFIMDRDVER